MKKETEFAKKMKEIDTIAKAQGAKNKKERVMFQIGWMFGQADILTGWDLVKKKERKK